MLFSLHLLFLLLILMMSDFSDLFRGAEQTAGCVDVLAAAGTDSGENTMGSEVITELLHLLIVHTLQRDVGNLMEADEIETAIKPLHQFDDGLGMLHTVVQPVLDAITRLAHYNGRGGMFTAFEAFQINMALGKDDKRETSEHFSEMRRAEEKISLISGSSLSVTSSLNEETNTNLIAHNNSGLIFPSCCLD